MSMTNSIWSRSLWDLNFILCPHRFPTKPAKKDGESSLRSYQFYWKIYFSRDPNQSKARQEELQISGLSSGWLRIVLVTASVNWFCFALFVLLIIINVFSCSEPKQIYYQELGHTLTSLMGFSCSAQDWVLSSCMLFSSAPKDTLLAVSSNTGVSLGKLMFLRYTYFSS